MLQLQFFQYCLWFHFSYNQRLFPGEWECWLCCTWYRSICTGKLSYRPKRCCQNQNETDIRTYLMICIHSDMRIIVFSLQFCRSTAKKRIQFNWSMVYWNASSNLTCGIGIWNYVGYQEICAKPQPDQLWQTVQIHWFDKSSTLCSIFHIL